jgi:GH25 family lysozyme M1 (1,4-beta-N-acetylmuramidase)
VQGRDPQLFRPAADNSPMRPTRLLPLALPALLACNAPTNPLKMAEATSRDAVTACAAGPTLPGIDVSHYQGIIDWGQVAGSGIKWGYTKATEDTGYVDPTFAGNWSGMKAAGVVRGAYHFFHPSVDGKAQADFFLATVGPLGAGDLPPMLDWEVTDGVSGSTAAASADAFIAEIQARTGKTPVIYTSPGLWSGFGVPRSYAAEPLCVAEYFSCFCNSAGYCPNTPSGWSSWVMWQYSDRGSVPGISTQVDLDTFNGDAAALAAFTGGTASCTGSNGVDQPVGAGGPVSGACGGAAPAVSAPTTCGGLSPGQGLSRGQSVGSCDGRFVLAMQTDGNLVLYSNGIAAWASDTSGTASEVAAMQGDGNLVLYSATGCPLWASKTDGHPGSDLAVQNDGNLVIYGGGNALWSSGSGPILPAPTGCGGLGSNTSLSSGASVVACGGCFSLILQGDGNLVVYKDGAGAVWSSGTAGQGGYTAAMQPDGDLVLYARTGCPIWSSGSGGHPGATLAVQDDGNLVVYAGGTAVWSSNTVTCAGGCTCNTTTATSTASSTTGTSATATSTASSTSGTSASSAASSTTGGTSSTMASASATGTLGSTSSGTTGHSASGAGGTSAGKKLTSSGGCGSTDAGSLAWSLSGVLVALRRRR